MIAACAAVLMLCLAAAAVGRQSLFAGKPNPSGEIGPKYSMTSNGRWLRPVGRMTTVGNFPTGGALTPNGKYYWVVDSGWGDDDVKIMRVSDGKVIQTLPLPGGYGGIAFSPDGTRAYVSGEPKGNPTPSGPTRADTGDAIHTYHIDPGTGTATEGDPIVLPKLAPGNQQSASTNQDWPEGLAVAPDGNTLVVALNQVDQAAIINLTTRDIKTVKVGSFPSWAVIDPQGKFAYVTNEYAGTVSKIDLSSDTVADTIAVGGSGPNPNGNPDPNTNAQPESPAMDATGTNLYVPIANRDVVATINLATDKVSYISVKRGNQLGAEPVSVALSPNGNRLYVADENEDNVGVVDLRSQREIGRVPTAAFPTTVAVTPANKLLWVSGKGLGSGPNPSYRNGETLTNYVLGMEFGRVGLLSAPRGEQLTSDTITADSQMTPANYQAPPKNTVIRPHGPIKHVFYIIKENRTYDQIFGSEGKHGDGDPALEVFDSNGVSGPTGGITPNAHALADQFGLLDHLYADSDVSQDGHQITDSGIGSNFVERDQHSNYSGRGRSISNDNAPVAAPPRDYIFDQAVRQGLTFRNYGEYGAKTVIDDGRPTFAASVANKDASYPGGFGCGAVPVNDQNCDWDHGTMGTAADEQKSNSRFDTFEAEFDKQLKNNSVPALNVMIMPNDHTNGTTPGHPTPSALVADNDLALGQMVQRISHSKIWKSSAIFVVEDDSQDGADHVDSHRMPSFAISPYTKHHSVISTRYDQDSVIRTMEIILGLKPLGSDDAVATPMYNAFTTHPNMAKYTAITPTYDMSTVNKANAPDAQLSKAMPWRTPDAVPQPIADKIIWHSVHGAKSPAPLPGPNASEDEWSRARTAVSAYRNHQNVGTALRRSGTVIDEGGVN